jgi:hypothetical protein
VPVRIEIRRDVSRFTYNAQRYSRSFRSFPFAVRKPRKIFDEKHTWRFSAIQRVAFRKLVMLHAAKVVSDPAYCLRRLGFYAGFRWPRGRAFFFGAAAVERGRRGGWLSIAARKMRLMRVW